MPDGKSIRRNIKAPVAVRGFLVVLFVLLCGCILPILCYRYDNKYTRPRPYAEAGVIRLDMDWYQENPFFYLVDGWNFYEDRLLTPEELAGQTPAAQELAAQEPAAQEPTAQEPAAQTPAAQEPTAQEPAAQTPAAQEPAARTPAAQEPANQSRTAQLPIPDRSFYLGRYGGFDFGDPEANPHGKGTYRMEIVTDGVEREYALELTQIYSAWDLWINGNLVQSVGMGRVNPPEGDNRMVTFRARDRIEIVVAVSDENHYYSGMVYPPAFGSARSVGLMLSLRLLIHGGFCAVALLVAVLCLFWGWGCRFARPYGALALLCLACCGSSCWPVFQAMGDTGEAWPLLERVCYYGIFLTVIWLQGRICRLPRKAVIPACMVGVAIECLILVQPWIPVDRAIWYLRFSALLSAYKWFTALWLMASGIWACIRRREYAGVMTAGSGIFALALVMGQWLPLHEPVLLGWFVELAAGVLVLLVTGILWYDTVRLYQESVKLKVGRELAQIQLDAREEQAALQQEYVRRTREQLHESRHRLTLIRHYLDTGELEQLSGYVEGLTAEESCRDSREYTGHRLIDALLTTHLMKADQAGVYVELDMDTLPDMLPISDDDITVCLLNLLDNALESCVKIPEQDERWISLRIGLEGAEMQIACSNAAQAEDHTVRTSKEDKQSHGFGLGNIRNIVSAHDGSMEIERTEDSCHVLLNLNLKFC